MTVKQLIEELQKIEDQNLIVVNNSYGKSPVRVVSVELVNEYEGDPDYRVVTIF